ncbi:secretory phospholipase A2 receptor [Aphelenchoides avenae]|nr:secretory phospholipase A2 receptor [Aphelenchus avenae]
MNAANRLCRALPCSTSLPYICKVADNTPPAVPNKETDKGAKKPISDDASNPADKPTEENPKKPSDSKLSEGHQDSRQCQKDGGDLASFGPFNDLLSDKEEGDYLIGLKYEPTSDPWRWPNGTEATATNWMHSLPNGYESGLSGCVYAKHSKTPGFVNEGKWANWFCDIDAFAICEKHL